MVIKHTSFKHGWFYHYRVHNPKTSSLTNGFESLREFLYRVFDECPDDYFNIGPRSSSLKFNLPLDVKEVEHNELKELTTHGLNINNMRYKSNHSRVQMFMLENDQKTIAIEVPIWLKHSDINCFKNIFDCKDPLTGHIDILRIEDEKIWVWDYKPNAHKEKYASTQTYFYALMLSKRTGIPLDDFRCGYFDQNHAFAFKPEEKIISNIKL
ncbi:MAG: PD-(D/E)XK nuclease family protein [Nanoarchaeota archaeon]|nr:PD-(D/E)XK nuclease family protein [Nanoarchaeota archaeon]